MEQASGKGSLIKTGKHTHTHTHKAAGKVDVSVGLLQKSTDLYLSHLAQLNLDCFITQQKVNNLPFMLT